MHARVSYFNVSYLALCAVFVLYKKKKVHAQRMKQSWTSGSIIEQRTSIATVVKTDTTRAVVAKAASTESFWERFLRAYLDDGRDVKPQRHQNEREHGHPRDVVRWGVVHHRASTLPGHPLRPEGELIRQEPQQQQEKQATAVVPV